MPLLISWSIAFDTIIQTVWEFRTQDNRANTHLHLSLFSPVIRKEYGGTAANIAYSLALLGKNSYMIGSVGEDAVEYLSRLRDMGINTELVQTIPWSYSAQAYILRDEEKGQINTFHPWAMSSSGELTHGNITFQYAIIAPDSRDGMIRRVNECTNRGIFTIFDPGQAMGVFSREELIDLTSKAQITIMNEPERAQFLEMTGEDFIHICQGRWHTGIVTLSDKWSIIISQSDEIIIPAIDRVTVVDATGCGDAFRAGLIYGLSENWNLERSCQLWSILGWIKVEYMWGQNHSFSRSEIDTIGQERFGTKFFD